MDQSIVAKIWEKKVIEELNRKPLFIRVFIPKYKMFPRLCKLMKLGKFEMKVNQEVGTTVKINSINGVNING